MFMKYEYKVKQDTTVGYDKRYTLSECKQSELEKLYNDLPKVRNRFITRHEKKARNTATKPDGADSAK